MCSKQQRAKQTPACQVLECGVADNVVGVGKAELGEGGVVHQVQQGVGGDGGGGHIEDHQLPQLLHALQAADLRHAAAMNTHFQHTAAVSTR